MMEPSGPWTWTVFQKRAKQVALQIRKMLVNETKFFPGHLAWGKEELERASTSLSPGYWHPLGTDWTPFFLFSGAILGWVLSAVLDVYHFVHPKAALSTTIFLTLVALLIDDTRIFNMPFDLRHSIDLKHVHGSVSPSYEIQTSQGWKGPSTLAHFLECLLKHPSLQSHL